MVCSMRRPAAGAVCKRGVEAGVLAVAVEAEGAAVVVACRLAAAVVPEVVVVVVGFQVVGLVVLPLRWGLACRGLLLVVQLAVRRLGMDGSRSWKRRTTRPVLRRVFAAGRGLGGAGCPWLWIGARRAGMVPRPRWLVCR